MRNRARIPKGVPGLRRSSVPRPIGTTGQVPHKPCSSEPVTCPRHSCVPRVGSVVLPPSLRHRLWFIHPPAGQVQGDRIPACAARRRVRRPDVRDWLPQPPARVERCGIGSPHEPPVGRYSLASGSHVDVARKAADDPSQACAPRERSCEPAGHRGFGAGVCSVGRWPRGRIREWPQPRASILCLRWRWCRAGFADSVRASHCTYTGLRFRELRNASSPGMH